MLSETTYSVLISGLLFMYPLRYAFSSIAVIVLTAVSFFGFFHKPELKAYWPPILFICLDALIPALERGGSKSLRGLERQLPF